MNSDYVQVCVDTLKGCSDDVPFMTLCNIRAIAKCVNVYDGDTLWLKVDLGSLWGVVRLKCRMWGYDTSEMRGGTKDTKELALRAKKQLEDLVLGKCVFVRFGDFDMYGRPLVQIYTIATDSHGDTTKLSKSVNQEMVSSGNAILYHGSGEKKNARDEQSFTAGRSIDDIIAGYAACASQIPPMNPEAKWNYELFEESAWNAKNNKRKRFRRRKHRKHRDHSSSSGSDSDHHYHHRRRHSHSHSSSSSD